jgi:glycosyltransferase involved in cell wall biosynthesis
MNDIKKVAHVMRRFSLEKWGGTESVVFNVSRELIKRGIESPIYCTDMFSKPGEERVEAVPARRFRYVFPWFGLSEAAKAKLRLKGGSPLAPGLFFALLFEKDLSVIHTHVQHRLGGMARTVAKLRKIPYVVSIHGGHFTLPEGQYVKMMDPFKGKVEWGRLFGLLLGARKVLDDAAAVICVGENEYQQMQQRYPQKPVFYLPNGVRTELFTQADGTLFRNHYGIGDDEKLILCASRIDYQKNQLGLVRAFATFAATRPAYRLVLIGPVTVEDYYQEILETIRSLGIEERVLIIKGFSPDDPLLPSAYKAAELFALPTHHEPFGIVILEAWAARLPVVANRVGGIPGFTTDERNILLVEPDDEAGFAEQMGRVSDDETLRLRLMEEAWAEVSATYDWSMIVDRVCEIYRQSMRGRAGSFLSGLKRN